MGIPIKASPHSRKVEWSKTQLENLESAFNAEYRDPHGWVNDFYEWCLEFVGSWYRDIYSPYTTLVQSSGTGKSRFLKELAKKMYTFYICLRKPTSSGYPYRSRICDVSRLLTEEDFRNFYIACILVLVDKLAGNPSYSPADLQQEIMAYDNDIARSGTEFWDLVIQKLPGKGQANFTKKDLAEAYDSCGKDLGPICFAFDEARQLLPLDTNTGSNAFRDSRRVLIEFDGEFPDKLDGKQATESDGEGSVAGERRKFKIMAIYTDTSTKMQT
jgi:hypothetical protein